ncbi:MULTISPECIES: hypothetical protein [unclassified Flavobacterium]|uniref:hypothetical protein n=1 Tax=unclassified Flavobacterium TaxID=196869 RepID=UPI00096809DD|nr:MULTISPECIES: hypothetical protein [unclassified Flavobacterium]MBN9284595.1 hypothetical protein [Flavobacterium sp.]OJV68152.1 MAG: hypothetical protein BGO42_00045 [Flavobacterium sp. 40-81]
MKDFELDTKQLKSITSFLVGIFIVGIIAWEFFYRTDDRFYNNLLESIRNEEYKGIVNEKYYDKENHNDPTLVLKSGEKVSVYGIIWGKIYLGDSIVKNKGETTLSSFRNDQKLIFDNKSIIDEIRKSK